MLELTSSEVSGLNNDTKVYQGVGKMSVVLCQVEIGGANRSRRFVFSPIDEVDERLSSETAELKSDISNLKKKLHYLETTQKNSREHIEKIMRSGGRS